ncbi:MAG: leucine--tRNA ligase [Candidatus Zixiibacteriota bacterium]
MSTESDTKPESRSGYDFSAIEAKWQKRWDEQKLFHAPDMPREKFYLLVMFAYPSGDIHMGHFRNYIIGDAMARYQWMLGKDVLHPFGWDAFGLPAENAAIKLGLHPADWTVKNIEVSRNTLKKVGISFDWDREVASCFPDYYRWSQWLFLKMYEHGLAYRKDSLVNFCTTCNTVLANEQVESDGTCWRCHDPVTKKRLNQWYLKITDYAERLLEGLDHLDGWSDRLKSIQRNWIGKSTGCEINFTLENSAIVIPVFTTRPDTIFGVTFMAIAPEAELLEKLPIPADRRKAVDEYIAKSIAKSEIERQAVSDDKDGVFTGLYAINPLSGERAQLWITDYVLASYGTGVVMGVPGHDERDFLFAKKYNVPIKVVIKPSGGDEPNAATMTEAYVEKGEMVNSGQFSGKIGAAGIDAVIAFAESKNIGQRKVNFKLRDWLISRQRYWGTPIPIIHCPKDGEVPVAYDDLPVKLPTEDVDYIPKGRSPLADATEWVNVKCPKCGGPAQRDPDTMDTFICSSWYMLRYTDNRNHKAPFDPAKANAWMPIDLYIGGITHATGHLIYFRFFTKFLKDIGLLKFEEPAVRMFNHGMVMDAQGRVMSKSLGNVVSPIQVMKERGVDISRLAMYFAAPADREMPWSNDGLVGVERFMNKLYRIVEQVAAAHPKPVDLKVFHDLAKLSSDAKSSYIRLNQTIKKVSEDLEQLQFNTSIAAIMEFFGAYAPSGGAANEFDKYVTSKTVQLIAPLAPHFAEEAWEMFGHKESILKSSWPKYDPKAISFDTVIVAIQINGKVRDEIEVEREASEDTVKALALGREKVMKNIEGKSIVKVIYVRGKLLSIVVK